MSLRRETEKEEPLSRTGQHWWINLFTANSIKYLANFWSSFSGFITHLVTNIITTD